MRSPPFYRLELEETFELSMASPWINSRPSPCSLRSPQPMLPVLNPPAFSQCHSPRLVPWDLQLHILYQPRHQTLGDYRTDSAERPGSKRQSLWLHRAGVIGRCIPVLHPGSIVLIDDKQCRIIPDGLDYRTQYTADLFFEHRGSVVCGWCSVVDEYLIVQPHPSSTLGPRLFELSESRRDRHRLSAWLCFWECKKPRRARSGATQASVSKSVR